jgi:hypothetical protein
MAPRAVKLLLEFDDGVRVERAFDSLPEPLQQELLRQPFACRPGSDEDRDGFLLLEWEDGWKEVLRVPAGVSQVNRYYVITRPEDVGRLSLKVEGGYPELIEISRRPGSLARMTLSGTYALQKARSEREGRKVEQHYQLVEQDDALGVLGDRLRDLVEQGGLDRSDLSSPSQEAGERAFDAIVAATGLVPARCRQDVLDFVARLLGDGLSDGSQDRLATTTGGGQ